MACRFGCPYKIAALTNRFRCAERLFRQDLNKIHSGDAPGAYRALCVRLPGLCVLNSLYIWPRFLAEAVFRRSL